MPPENYQLFYGMCLWVHLGIAENTSYLKPWAPRICFVWNSVRSSFFNLCILIPSGPVTYKSKELNIYLHEIDFINNDVESKIKIIAIGSKYCAENMGDIIMHSVIFQILSQVRLPKACCSCCALSDFYDFLLLIIYVST